MSEKEKNQIDKMKTSVPKEGDAFEVPDKELEEVSGGLEQDVDVCACLCGSGDGCSGGGGG